MSEMRSMMVESCRRFLADISSRENWEAQPHGKLPGEWQALCELGLPRVAMPDALGGVGGDFGDMCEFAFISGYSASFLPLVETMLPYWLCGLAGFDVPEDAVPVLLLSADFHQHGGQFPGLGMQATMSAVKGARFATHFLLPQAGPQGVLLSLHATGQRADSVTLRANAADEASDDVDLSRLGEPLATAHLDISHDRVCHAAALLQAFQIAGAMQRILEMTITYTLERSQFGRALARFQAVQHMVAEAAGYVSATARVCRAAAEAWDTPSFEVLAASAKGYASEGVQHVVDPAHQCFGAMGFTRECLLHVYTRRLWCWREEYGREQFWYRRIGDDVRQHARDGIWAYVTDL